VICDRQTTAGEEVKCYVGLRDRYGNVAGSEQSLGLLEAEARSSAGVRSATGITWVRSPTNGKRDVEVSFTLAASVSHDVDVTIMEGSTPVVMKNPQNAATVFVSPAEIDHSRCIAECPGTVPGSARIQCHVHTFDQYQNPSNENAQVAGYGSIVGVAGSEQYPTGRQVGDSIGSWVVEFMAPLNEADMELAILQANFEISLFNVTVRQLEINERNSSVICATDDIVAGSRASCMIHVFDMNMALIGTKELASAFVIDVSSGGAQLMTTITNVAKGTYRLSFVPLVSTSDFTSTLVHVSYRSSSGATPLGPPSMLPQHVNVIAGVIDPSLSEVHCQDVLEAGDHGHCFISLFDKYGNVAGDESVTKLISASASIMM
jgi:hypothetical protein